MDPYAGFKKGQWQTEINVSDFIKRNYTTYDGDSSFLENATPRTKALWKKVLNLMRKEIKKGILDLDVNTPSSITAFKPGYLDKKKELIVGIQTDKPLKRAIKPLGGIRLVEAAASAYKYKINPTISKVFRMYRKTHNDGVFSAYTPQMRLLRRHGILSGLPDNYSRGRIIGDYRRIALYGVDRLIEQKKIDLPSHKGMMDEDTVLLREQVHDQIDALNELKEMAASYGDNISKPAKNAKEAVQWVWYGYLASVKQQDGAAMSFGRIDAFLDIYLEHDLKKKKINERRAQELIDDIVMKMRMVRHLRPPAYNEIFAGDPTWITCVLGGATKEGKSMVTKTSFRMLHTLNNLGPAPEPNLTVLWSPKLSEAFKEFSAEVSIKSSSIQYENDDLMKAYYGDDYGVACCVSAMRLGKEMQFFGARCNLGKLLLLAINGGREEHTGIQVAPIAMKPLVGKLKYSKVMARFKKYLRWLCMEYVRTMNIIHIMHDKYNYESMEMALHDTDILRSMGFGIAGFSVVIDSLSSIKYGHVIAKSNKDGVVDSFDIDQDYPKFGNDIDKVDKIGVMLVEMFINELKKHKTYKNAEHTLSLLTITSNVMYGKKTGSTPDGRIDGLPFAPGANPMHGRDSSGAIASLNSVAKIPYKFCKDGISNTFSIVPTALGDTDEIRKRNLTALLNGYFTKKGYHINVNVLHRETLLDAMKHPENYPQLTIRVSGYAVNFVKLSRAHQEEVISRTFHGEM